MRDSYDPGGVSDRMAIIAAGGTPNYLSSALVLSFSDTCLVLKEKSERI